MTPFTLFACEAQPIVVEGLRSLLLAHASLQFVGSAPAPSEGMPRIRELRPDLVLLDQSAGLRTVLAFLAELRIVSERTRVVLWATDMPEVDCFRVLQSGARGVLRKALPLNVVVECLETVARGGVWMENSVSNRVVDLLNRKTVPRLTPREKEIVRQVCRGLRNKEIAEELSITSGTVKVHLMHIFEKTGVKDRFELALHGGRLLGAEDDVETISLGNGAKR